MFCCLLFCGCWRNRKLSVRELGTEGAERSADRVKKKKYPRIDGPGWARKDRQPRKPAVHSQGALRTGGPWRTEAERLSTEVPTAAPERQGEDSRHSRGVLFLPLANRIRARLLAVRTTADTGILNSAGWSQFDLPNSPGARQTSNAASEKATLHRPNRGARPADAIAPLLPPAPEPPLVENSMISRSEHKQRTPQSCRSRAQSLALSSYPA